MSYVIAAPEMMTAAATDLAGIGSAFSEAHMAAAPPTVALCDRPLRRRRNAVPDNNDKSIVDTAKLPSHVPKKQATAQQAEAVVDALMKERSRLEPQERREQLLDAGAALFAEKPYEDVLMEDIAARAGVSRATVYHYYPSKRVLYVAIFKRASTRLLARVSPDPQLPLADQLAAGLEAHIQYFVDHPFEAVAINRGALSDDPAIQAIISEELNVVGQRLIDKLVAEGRLRGVTEIAVEGWLAFVRAACVKWIQSQNISRAELTEMCLRAFDCALGHPNKLLASPNVRTIRSRLIALSPVTVNLQRGRRPVGLPSA